MVKKKFRENFFLSKFLQTHLDMPIHGHSENFSYLKTVPDMIKKFDPTEDVHFRSLNFFRTSS